jgi:transaldolase
MWDIGISILADSGDSADLIRWLEHPGIAGVTTNPSLLRNGGLGGQELLAAVAPHLNGRPVSIYPVAQSHDDLLRTADDLRSVYPGVFIKVPVASRDGAPNDGLLAKMAAEGHNINVTAVHDAEQAAAAEGATRGAPRRVVSVFAGRIADSGRNPLNVTMNVCQSLAHSDFPVIWASSRQVFDVALAQAAGCAMITIPTAILARARVWGFSSRELTSLAVQQFEGTPEGLSGEIPAGSSRSR